MAYTALYRKWRPLRFEDVKGQDAIVATLKNQIKSGRIGHAYLFCGTRGTGKTTVAKIFARAVNCEHPVDGSPCNECPSCKAIQASAAMNVVEIDAASNNGVDNIREIREEVQYSPAEGKYRVYIIDEVHMLSTGAFNALLKTLEEPPAYVIFILATTEVHKIPITVLSRCQRYDFRRIGLETIMDRLSEMVQAEGVQTEEKALRYIAKKADGSMRDAISLLDQCIAFYYGESLTYEKTLEVLGAVDNEVHSSLLRAAVEGQCGDCIRQIDELVMQGRELSQFVSDFIWYMRNLLLLKSEGGDEELFEMTAEDMALLQADGEKISEETLLRYVRIFSDLANQMRYSANKRVLLEVTFIKLAKPQMEQDLSSVLQRLSLLEKKVEQGFVPEGNFRKEAVSDTLGVQGGEAGSQKKPDGPKEKRLPKAQLEDLNRVKDSWKRIISMLEPAARISLQKTFVEPVEENIMCVVFPDDREYLVGSRQAVLEDLKGHAAEIIGKAVEFRARVLQDGEPSDVRYVSEEELMETFHMELSEE